MARKRASIRKLNAAKTEAFAGEAQSLVRRFNGSATPEMLIRFGINDRRVHVKLDRRVAETFLKQARRIKAQKSVILQTLVGSPA